MGGALIGAAVSIGSTLYNNSASAADKRKARKELRQLAKNYGVAYSELKDNLETYFKQNDPGYQDRSAELKDIVSGDAYSTDDSAQNAYEGYGKTRDDTYNEYVAALQDVLGYGDKSSQFEDSIRRNSNVYATAMDEFAAERNADYAKYQDLVDNYRNFLNSVNQQRTLAAQGLLNQQGYANKWGENNLATLANLMAAGQQTQNQLNSQAMGI